MSANTTQPVDTSDDLDDLDDILDEFNDSKKSTTTAPAATSSSSNAEPSSTSLGVGAGIPATTNTISKEEGEESEEELNERFARELAVGMEALMKGLGPEGEMPTGPAAASTTAAPNVGDGGNENLFNEEEMMKQFEQMMADMGLGGLAGMEGLGGAGLPTGSGQKEALLSSSSTSGPAANPAPPANFQDAIKNTMSRLRESDASASSSTGAGGDDMDLEKLMAALGNGEGMEGEEGISKMLETMMGELMSKDVLYEPLKELKDKYPGYLANPPKPLSTEDRARYESQYRIVTQVIDLFDDRKFDNGTEAEKTALKARVQTLMNEMQDNGAPPAEIVGDLPPELEGMSGLGDENCTVM